jgi:hypothetical protein
MDAAASELLDHWILPLFDLCERLRHAARGALFVARRNGDFSHVARVVGEGAGDTTYGLDAATEASLEEWAREVARVQPLSLLSEGRGWRHFGPGDGGARELAGFDHGGPRIVVDPVDGTRNLMTDQRLERGRDGAAGRGRAAPARDRLRRALGDPRHARRELPAALRLARRAVPLRGALVLQGRPDRQAGRDPQR